MRPIAAGCVVMADHPGLNTHLRDALEWEFSSGPVDLRLVRSLVSSPRLMSFCVKAFSHPALCAVGDTYLDARTMLADNTQKTYAISIREWTLLMGSLTFVDEFLGRDTSVMHIQVWPFDPASLDDFAMVVAVALSYTPAELVAESRISLAIDELVQQWGYSADWF